MTTDCLGCYSELRRGRPETHKETRLPGDAALVLPESRPARPPSRALGRGPRGLGRAGCGRQDVQKPRRHPGLTDDAVTAAL